MSPGLSGPSAPPPAPPTKAAARAVLRAALRGMDAGRRAELSTAAADLLARATLWRAARCVAAFYPLPSEPDLTPLLFPPADPMQSTQRAGPLIILPRLDGNRLVFCRVSSANDLADGPFGLREPSAACPPTPLNSADLVLVPGLGFTPSGQRLGRGGGFYDRALEGIDPSRIVGVCFPEQILSSLPTEPHDRRVGWILDGRHLRQAIAPSPEVRL